MDTGVFPRGKGAEAEVKERVELYLYSPSGAFVACPRANFTCTLPYLVQVGVELHGSAVLCG